MNTNYSVTLGQYKGLKVARPSDIPTQAELEAFMQGAREQNATLVPVEGPAALGDTVVLDFAGFLGEEQFEGGTAQNHSLTLGSGTFIPGFEEQLVGHAAGEDVDVNVTFPTAYHAPELAGKAVVFRCRLHQVQRQQLPELDDAFAQNVYGAVSYAALLEVARSALAEQKAKQNLQTVQNQLMQQILAGSQVTVSANFVQQNQQQLLRAFAQQLASQGMELDMYYQYTGTTQDDLLAQLRPQAESSARVNAILSEIARVEGLEIPDAVLDGEIAKIAESYDVSLEELKAGMTPANRAAIRQGMLTARALDLILASSIPQ